MPVSKKTRLLPDVKPCEWCSQPYTRHPRYSDKRWGRSRFCSLACASACGRTVKAEKAESIEDRFWGGLDRSKGLGPQGDCWEWAKGRVQQGYGRLSVGRSEVRAHRFSYELAYGPIPEGMMVCHRCDNPPCCNPEHLFLGTALENNQDKAEKDRTLYGEDHHKAKLKDEDIIAIRNDPRSHRQMAAVYGVTHGLIGMIRRREIWARVE